MGTAEDLMQRLAVSKKIMEKHNEIKRGDARSINPSVQEFEPVSANYNIPQEFISEQTTPKSTYDPSQPLDMDRIKNSKLPDEIKQLMFEHPIVQPSSIGATALSDEVIEGAQRLMGKTNKITEQPKEIKTQTTKIITENHTNSNINVSEIKNMIRDVVRDTVRDVVREELKDAGMLVESTQNSNETIQFKVGQHLFIGKVTKIKKLEK
jgi:flagellar biosynthesis component FlhA